MTSQLRSGILQVLRESQENPTENAIEGGYTTAFDVQNFILQREGFRVGVQEIDRELEEMKKEELVEQHSRDHRLWRLAVLSDAQFSLGSAKLGDQTATLGDDLQ